MLSFGFLQASGLGPRASGLVIHFGMRTLGLVEPTSVGPSSSMKKGLVAILIEKQTGQLLSIDSQEGVVKLDHSGDVKMLQLKYLLRHVQKEFLVARSCFLKLISTASAP